MGSDAASTNAATSWFVIPSISATRSGVGTLAPCLISSRSTAGTTPSRAQPSTASSSIRSQVASLASSDQTAAISGRVYRGIIARPPGGSRTQPLRELVLELPDLGPHGLVLHGHDLGGQDGGVRRSVDGHG